MISGSVAGGLAIEGLKCIAEYIASIMIDLFVQGMRETVRQYHASSEIHGDSRRQRTPCGIIKKSGGAIFVSLLILITLGTPYTGFGYESASLKAKWMGWI